MLQHDTEIAARPARTWFLSNRDKALNQKAARREEPTAVRAVHAQLPDARPSGRGAVAPGANGPELAGKERRQVQLTRKQKRKREAERELTAQTGKDAEALLREAKMAARSHKALAKASPGAAEQALRAARAGSKPKVKATNPRRGGQGASGDGGSSRAVKHKRKNHSKKAQIRRHR